MKAIYINGDRYYYEYERGHVSIYNADRKSESTFVGNYDSIEDFQYEVNNAKK